MLDNLILAYRAQFYDWNFSKWKEFCKKNKMLVIISGILLLVLIISIVISIIFKSYLLMTIILFCEGIVAILVDRYAVKQYRQSLLSRKHHLDETISFLKTALENKLFGAEQVEELTARLTKHIESKSPFKDFLTGLNNFAKAIILPVITYVAGVYSGNLGKFDFATVTNWAVSVVLLLGIAHFTWSYILTFLRIVICRNYDAAIALREDLMDIKLLYFSNGNI